MSNRIIRTTEPLHPILIACVNKIQNNVINTHSMPFRLFESGRSHDRHQSLLRKGKTKDIMSQHLFDLEHTPPLYATAVDYVYYDGKWSWNIRNGSIKSWYKLLGNLILDTCPELKWCGLNRKQTNYSQIQLRDSVNIENLDKYPCVEP